MTFSIKLVIMRCTFGENVMEIGAILFELSRRKQLLTELQTDRQTDRQTDKQTDVFNILAEGKS